MRRKLNVCVWALGLCGVLAGGAVQAMPAAVNWSYDGAWQRDNGLRGEISLNGWWRWQMVDTNSAALPTGGWAYRKLPGVGPCFDILDETGTNWLAGKPPEIAKRAPNVPNWAEREFTVPSAWRDRDVRIMLDSVEGEAEVWLDGKRLGVTWGGLAHEMPLPKPYKPDAYRLTFRIKGAVVCNVWLKSVKPSGAEVRDCYLMTSVRKMEGTIRAAGTGKAAAAVRVVVTDYRKPDAVVKTAGPFPVASTHDGWAVEQAFPWKDAKLWSLDHPNLYEYTLEVLDAKGQAIDRIFPIRFGFREVWAQGGRFMLNNRPITLNMDIHSPIGHAFGQFRDEEGWRAIIRQFKGLGINTAIHRWVPLTDDTTLYRVADEEGFFISVDDVYLQGGAPEVSRLPEEQAYRLNANRNRLVYRRHCPSIPFYYLPSTANTWDFEPSKLGEDYDAEALFSRHTRPEQEFIREFDPARIAFSSSGGGKDQPVHSTMIYIHIDADLQVHETWPSYWYTKQTRPLATYEMAAPPFIGNWFMRRSRGDAAHGTPGAVPFWMEVGAIYLGEEPYVKEPREVIKANLECIRANKPGYTTRSVWVSPQVADLFTRNVYRAWRTYGVNMGLFTQAGSYISGPGTNFTALKIDPRQPGLTPDNNVRGRGEMVRVGELSKLGEIAQSVLRELVVYIGGAGGEFTKKDHTWFSGEEVRKAVVMMNNFDDPVTVAGAWTLTDAASNVVQRGTLPRTVLAPGEIAPAKVHIAFPAPAVKARTDYTLTLAATADKPGTLEDSFRITVFPRPAAPALGKGVAVFLYDPVGDTRGVLQQAGVKFEELAGTLPDPGSLLIVGRSALKSEADRKAFGALLYRKMGYDFATNVRNGLRVIVFEQGVDNLWGLQTEQSRWRRTFPVAPGHPALAGLSGDDFLYLKGDSSLAEAYPPASKGAGNSRVSTDRFPDWGNDNSVVTYSIVRPQIGACRALIACGFDLQEAALLEVTAGKGRMLFCQVDVSNRYGKDPVSTLLVNNLLAYMTTAAEPDPGVGKPIDLVREGLDAYDVKVTNEKDVFMADRPAGEISWGITAADTYFEGFLDLPVIRGGTNEMFLYGKVPGKRPYVHVLNVRNFKTRWQKMKAMQVVAALTINQGSSADVLPEPGLQGKVEELYPMDWVEGFVHPYLFMNW